GLHRQHQAGADDVAIDAQRAGAADAVLAADMRTRQLQLVAQEIGEIGPRQHQGVDRLTIYLARDGHIRGHAKTPASSAETPRTSSTFARCRRIAAEACWSSCGSSSSANAAPASDNSA